FEITSLPTDVPHEELADVEFDRLNEALEILSSVDPRLAECVDLKFFCGMTYEDIGEMWSVSERTVRRDWDKARVLLHRALNGQAIQ
ncbi:MAG TPA: ECF-type sigma factor, partial [Steroidobacteraceae bacterium]|nr:ECF-type sigma factor [Steroidobacteraceae bacterium]